MQMIRAWNAAATALAVLIGALPAAGQGDPPRVLAFVESLDGSEETELRWPVAVAAASAEEVAVADISGPRLMRFRKVGVSWQLDGSAPMPGAPVALVWDGARYVASMRQGKGLVAFEGAELAQRRLPLPRGVVPGALAVYPTGELLVFDYAGGRALRLSRGGAPPELEVAIGERVTALAADSAGGFFAAVPGSAAVLHFDATGALAATWPLAPFEGVPAWPVGLAVEPGGDVLVVDRHGSRLLVIDARGEWVGLGSRDGWEPGLLRYPAGIARLPDGQVLVADQGNGRAQVFRRTDRSGP